MWESWDMSDATRTPPVRGHRELRNFKQPNVQFLWEWDVNSSSHTSRGVRTSRLCQMVAFHVGIMGHVRRNSYTSCTRPQGARNFKQPNVQFLWEWDVNSSSHTSRGCTNKPFVPDGSLPCGNHGTCQTQLVHLLYEATGSFEISNSPMYSSYGSGM